MTACREDAAAFEPQPFGPCEPTPHEAHDDNYGDCPGFIGPPTQGWADYMAEGEAYERCRVITFREDPITRMAGLDEAEERPIIRRLREECAESGCPLCNHTTGCYFCHQEAGGSVTEQDQAKLPQRRVVDERTVNPADPTSMLTLSCGHSII